MRITAGDARVMDPCFNRYGSSTGANMKTATVGAPARWLPNTPLRVKSSSVITI
jgi:hypothetical protein